MTTEIKNKINAQEAQSIITHRGPSLVALMYVHLKLHISSKMGLGSPCTFSFIIQKTVKVNLLMEIGVIIFGSVRFLSKKVTKLKYFFFEKKNRNRVKPTGFGSVRFGFLGQKPVQTGLARFSRFFPVLARFFRFWLGFSGLARFFVGFGSVRFGFSVFCL